MTEKKDVEEGSSKKVAFELPTLPKPLTLEEKKYLLAVERGDLASVKRMIQKAYRHKNMNINCVDSLGRGALTLAIDSENLEMVELLIIMGVETHDALLQAITAEFVEAVELLLEHEELIHKDGEPYSWQKVDKNISPFSTDVTPLMVAAQKNNYEIIKVLLDRGATLPMPHDIKCGCDECLRKSEDDPLKFSLQRLNEYRAMASPSLIALSATDPLLTAFELSWELRNLAFAEQECKNEYLELRRQCQQFAVDLLDQSRSSQELAIILNHDPDNIVDDGSMKLARLELAIDLKQKKFVAHPNIQQLLASLWYEGVPGFRRKSTIEKIQICFTVVTLFPLYCTMYMLLPTTKAAQLMRKPFMKFLIHAASYLFFLWILILVSQRAEVQAIELFGTEAMKAKLHEELKKQRGNPPTYLEMLLVVYVLGFIWEETSEIYHVGMRSYLRNMWNFIDFTRNSLYVGVFFLRILAFIQQQSEIAKDPQSQFIPREKWDPFDPQLIAEGLFAAANIFSAVKLVHVFSINPHLGPLQISLGRMVIDIIKFFFIYSLVLFAFACGLNQLLWYFAELERKKCYVLPGDMADWDNNGDSCLKWRYFANVFEATQSLFWASFGMVGMENFELTGIKTYTRFWGLLMFGSYSVINVIVLLNLLIAMMSNSYAMIEEHSDVEWKFARTRLWMSYFEESATLPPPFNILPTTKMVLNLLGLRKKSKSEQLSPEEKEEKEKERDLRYTAVMRALVWRYVSAMHRRLEENPVTEDDVNEIKSDISTMRFELLDVLERNGMDVSSADRTEKTVLGKQNKVWERRLMKDFQVAPITAEEHAEIDEDESKLSKFRRLAKMAAANTISAKWGQVVSGAVGEASQIGRCHSKESYIQQQNLQRAMEEAKKIVERPATGRSQTASPISVPDVTGANILDLLKDIDSSMSPPESSKNTLSAPSKSAVRSGSVSPALSMLSTQVRPASTTSESKQKTAKSPCPTPTKTPQPLTPSQSPTPSMGLQSLRKTPEAKTPELKGKSAEERKVTSPTPLFPSAMSPPPSISVHSEDKVDITPDHLRTASEEPLEPLVVLKDEPAVKSPKRPAPKPAINRPVHSDIPTTGAIPAPPSKVKAPQPPTPVVTPTKARAVSSAAKTPPPEPVRSASSTSGAIVSSGMIAVSSMETLLPTEHEGQARGTAKVPDVKTVKRQPKTGWL